jgi:hypothetical protein
MEVAMYRVLLIISVFMFCSCDSLVLEGVVSSAQERSVSNFESGFDSGNVTEFESGSVVEFESGSVVEFESGASADF